MDTYQLSLVRVRESLADLQAGFARRQLFNLPTAATPSTSRVAAIMSARMLLPPLPPLWAGPVAPCALVSYVAPAGFGAWAWGVLAVDRAGQVLVEGKGTTSA